MLNEREIELIASLAEGTLEDETEARALIERSQEAREEYEAHRLTLQALSGVTPVSLTEHERAALHRDVWTALRADPAPAPGKAPWYYRWVFAAAGLFLVVGLVAVLSQTGGNDSLDMGATAETMSAGDAAATTTQAEATDLTSAGEDGDDAADGAAEEAADTMAMAPEEFFAQTAEQVRSGQFDESFTRSYTVTEREDRASCLEEAIAQAVMEDHEVIGEADHSESTDEEPTSTTYLLAVPTDTVIGPDTPVVFVSIEACEIAHVEE